MRLIHVATPSVFMSSGFAAYAEGITVISGAAVEPGLEAATAAFAQETGQKVHITYNTTPEIRKRVAAGDTFDVLIAPPAAVEEFVKAGKVETNGVDIGRVGAGVALRPGAPVPAIATAGDIKKAVLEAESVVFNYASSGIYFENLLKKMGVWEQVEPKTTRYVTGVEVMMHLLKGKGREIGFGPITEILKEKEKGIVLAGPLPPEIQNYTSYTAVPMSAGQRKDAARALVKFFVGPVGKPLFVATGIE